MIDVAADFTDITDKKTASVGLTRLEADGLLKRVIRGVYYTAGSAARWASRFCGQRTRMRRRPRRCTTMRRSRSAGTCGSTASPPSRWSFACCSRRPARRKKLRASQRRRSFSIFFVPEETVRAAAGAGAERGRCKSRRRRKGGASRVCRTARRARSRRVRRKAARHCVRARHTRR